MAVVSGDIIEVTCNHPTLPQGVFKPKAGEDSTYDLGGFRGDDSADGVTGSGVTIRKLNNNRWFFEVPYALDMNTDEDLEKFNLYAKSPVEGTWTFTHINGTVYKGVGAPVGDLRMNGNAGTGTIKISGGGLLVKISG